VGTEPHINPFETIQLGQNLVDPAPSVPDDEPTKETAGPGAATDSATPPPAPGAAAAEPVETAPDPVETAPDPVEAAPDPVEPTPEPVEPATEPAAQAPFPGEVPEPSLADLVGAYLGADGGKQREAEKALRAGARAAADRREFGVLADLVELMADSAEGGDEDRDLRALIEEFTSPAVASVIVARLASSEEEGERARLGRVLSQVGPEGALALTDALEQARDRFERKNLLGAMVGLGPWGFEMAKRMVDDPRWYVVRNGVAVLGEIGGMDAVSHLTSTLASRDRRVRRETVRALAKIGGADAESLLLGMLSDGETEVRSGACRALGLLGSIRAVRRLQDLMDDPEQDVQVECIQALGRIGDPGPVQSIEKKAFGGFFSRPPREVRIAAFRALAAIGTPRAVKALERGAKDSDGKVRASVRTLLGVA